MTNTNQASELFELCKEVYELTEWEDDLDHFDAGDTPIYTSDYLLDKLPYKIGEANSAIWLRLGKTRNGFTVFYIGSDLVWLYECESDTPLKALLKLTIALSEAGELKDE